MTYDEAQTVIDDIEEAMLARGESLDGPFDNPYGAPKPLASAYARLDRIYYDTEYRGSKSLADALATLTLYAQETKS